MQLVKHDSQDPFFNLALEEYLFRNLEGDFIRLWRNKPCVVIGKHQNPLKEVNLKFVREQEIQLVRRLSGGGTVYHDMGNWNFTFIMSRDTDLVVDFRKYMKPIFEGIRKLIPEIEYSERNDLFLKGKKFSGNAEHAFKRRVLHHGTLLFDSDLDMLVKAIQPAQLNIEDKSVNSVRSKVTNLSPNMESSMTGDQFRSYLEKCIEDEMSGVSEFRLTPDDILKVEKLVRDKYNTWDWNYGYSPKFDYRILLNESKKEIKLFVRKGIIENVEYDDESSNQSIDQLIHGLKGIKFNRNDLADFLVHLKNERVEQSIVNDLEKGLGFIW